MLYDFLKGNDFEVATTTLTWLWGIRRLGHFNDGKDGPRHGPAIYVRYIYSTQDKGLVGSGLRALVQVFHAVC
jgi:hypothetical protein